MFLEQFPAQAGRDYFFILQDAVEDPKLFVFSQNGQLVGTETEKYIHYKATNSEFLFLAGVGDAIAAGLTIYQYHNGYYEQTYSDLVTVGGEQTNVCGDVNGEVVTILPPQDGTNPRQHIIVHNPNAAVTTGALLLPDAGHSAVATTFAADGEVDVYVGAIGGGTFQVGFNNTQLGSCGLEDADCDGLGDDFEVALGTCSAPGDTHVTGWNCATFHPSDTDDDGIGDREELLGYCEGSDCVPFAYYGANPLHKDAFVEVDYANGLLPGMDAHQFAKNVYRTFADGWTTEWKNPDQKAGLHFHFDMEGKALLDYDCSVESDCAFSQTAVNPSLVYDGGGSNGVLEGCSGYQSAKAAAINHGHQDNFRKMHSFYACLGTGAQGAYLSPFLTFKSSSTFAHEFGHTLGLDHGGSGGGNGKMNYFSLMSYTNQERVDENGITRFSHGLHPSLMPLIDERDSPALNSPTIDNVYDAYGLDYFESDAGTVSVDWNRDGVFNDTPVRAPTRLSPLGTNVGLSGKSHGLFHHKTAGVASSAPTLAALPSGDGENDDVYAIYVDNGTVKSQFLDSAYLRDAYTWSVLGGQWTSPTPVTGISSAEAVSALVVDGEILLAISESGGWVRFKKLTPNPDQSLSATSFGLPGHNTLRSTLAEEPVGFVSVDDVLHIAWRADNSDVFVSELLLGGDAGTTLQWFDEDIGVSSNRPVVLATRPMGGGESLHILTQTSGADRLRIHQRSSSGTWSQHYGSGATADTGTKPSLTWMPTDGDAPNGVWMLGYYNGKRPKTVYVNDECAQTDRTCRGFFMLDGNSADARLGLTSVVGQTRGAPRLFIIGQNGGQLEFYPQGDGFPNYAVPDNNDFVLMSRNICTTLRNRNNDDRKCGDGRANEFVATGENESNNTVTLVGDFDGDGFDDAFFYKAGSAIESAWYGTATGTFDVVTQPNANANYVPAVGDFDGDGVDDIFFYRPGSGNEYLHFGESNRTFTSFRTQSVNGTYTPLVGDYNNDGRDDVLWYKQSSGITYIWYATATRNSWDTSQSPPAFNRTGYKPVAGDFNGDGAGDIFWFKPDCSPESYWFTDTDTNSFVIVDAPQVHNDTCSTIRDYDLQAADVNGDGVDDILFYLQGASSSPVWLMQSNTGGHHGIVVSLDGDGTPTLGDFTGDGVADTLWLAP